MVAPEQDLPPGQSHDVFEIPLALGRIPAPAVVAGQHQGIFGPDQPCAGLCERLLVVLPQRIGQLIAGCPAGTEMQVKIADGVQAHGCSSGQVRSKA